jgi:peptidoglycan/xylan/chitin deacetylase (PgdA/CDA1 family)
VLAATISCERERDPDPAGIPDRTVVLTFDDASRSHLERVAPLLEELGFGATFFVTAYHMADSGNYLGWEEVAKLHRMGFEIGNHSWSHAGFHNPAVAETMVVDLGRVEDRLASIGVPRPTCFAWPGNCFGPEAVEALSGYGYRFARRGMQPEFPDGHHVGPLYDPEVHHPLLIPTSGDLRHGQTFPIFREIVDRAEPGKAVVLQFHGVPDPGNPDVSTDPDLFRRYMLYLRDGGFRVIALRDLARWVDPEKRPDDPMAGVRHPKR